MTRGTFTRQEIFSQPQAWADALQVLHANDDDLTHLFHESAYDNIVFTGCGSTYYLSLSAAALTQTLTGRAARALPASEIWLYPQSAFLPAARTLLVAVSRSGETTETLHAVERFRAEANGNVVTLSCYSDKVLASIGDINVVLPSGQEQSVAQTRAFSVLYLATVFTAIRWANRATMLDELEHLPKVGTTLLENYRELAVQWGQKLDLERFYFLGSGPRYGLACELSLKMKEMTLSHSEPFHFMEFRHGPQSMVTTDTLMFGLVSQTQFDGEKRVLQEMAHRGAQTLSFGEANTDVTFASKLHEAIRNVLFLPIGQLMAFERAMAKNLNPDRPHNLEAVVRLDP